jgi:hypothetical protein
MNIIHQKSEPNKFLREQINELLKGHFGIDTITSLPIWRVSWAPDHYEKRYGTWEDYGAGGIFLRRVTEMREVPKYPHLPQHYIFERLVIVPPEQSRELCRAVISYEPIHPFWDSNTDPLPPNWEVCKFIVDTIYAAMGKSSLRKYVDPDADGNNGLDAQKERLKKIMDGLYGNHTDVSDALGEGSGVFIDSTKGMKPN